MFELFSEAVQSHYGVQCTCSAEKLVLAVRCLNFPCLMVFIIIYAVTTVVAAKFISKFYYISIDLEVHIQPKVHKS